VKFLPKLDGDIVHCVELADLTGCVRNYRDVDALMAARLLRRRYIETQNTALQPAKKAH